MFIMQYTMWICHKVIVYFYLAESKMQYVRLKCSKIKGDIIGYRYKLNEQALVSQSYIIDPLWLIFEYRKYRKINFLG